LISGIKIDRLNNQSLNLRYSSTGHVMQSSIYHSSLFQPLRQPRFRQLWFANLLSNVGSWGHAFAATWHVSALSQSAMMTSLVQAATWAPMLLFALPAGLLADSMHQPRLLFRTNALMGLTAGAMALLTIGGTQSAVLMLLMTFLMGAGAAFTLPAWQTSTSELVPKADIAAVASLNNLNYNAAALAGPFLGGLLFQQYGPTPLYLFNALSFCGLLWLHKPWQPLNTVRATIVQSRTNARLAGIAASWTAVRYRTLLFHSLFIFCLSIGFQALLPSLLRGTRADAGDFGILMGALGAGAVLASTILPRLRRHVRHRSVLAGALVVYASDARAVRPYPVGARTRAADRVRRYTLVRHRHDAQPGRTHRIPDGAAGTHPVDLHFHECGRPDHRRRAMGSIGSLLRYRCHSALHSRRDGGVCRFNILFSRFPGE
jgi:MFS family permease